MKKLFLVLSLIPLTSFGQVIIGQPKFGDNPLAQEVPLKENRVVDMSFIDTLLYKVKDSTILNDSFITDINSRYDSVLNELYGIEILNCEIFQNQLLIHVDVTDKIYYTPAVFRYRIPGISIGTIFLDLYNIETSFQNGTLLNDIGEIFEILNKQ
tara:strand:- start:1718 stop:2182 length:465 start_codon:yes stop_codon:yes gene_type:complete